MCRYYTESVSRSESESPNSNQYERALLSFRHVTLVIMAWVVAYFRTGVLANLLLGNRLSAPRFLFFVYLSSRCGGELTPYLLCGG